MYVCMHICVYINICMYIYLFLYSCINKYMYLCVYIYVYTYIFAVKNKKEVKKNGSHGFGPNLSRSRSNINESRLEH